MIFTRKSATISEDGTYRFTVEREWLANPERMLFIMLNPSTADATRDDRTITKCVNIAHHNGYGGILVANLFALRATLPQELLPHRDPVGPSNDSYLTHLANTCENAVAGWGISAQHHPLFNQRTTLVKELFKDRLFCLKLTIDGEPTHPLARGHNSVRSTTIPQPWA